MDFLAWLPGIALFLYIARQKQSDDRLVREEQLVALSGRVELLAKQLDETLALLARE